MILKAQNEGEAEEHHAAQRVEVDGRVAVLVRGIELIVDGRL